MVRIDDMSEEMTDGQHYVSMAKQKEAKECGLKVKVKQATVK